MVIECGVLILPIPLVILFARLLYIIRKDKDLLQTDAKQVETVETAAMPMAQAPKVLPVLMAFVGVTQAGICLGTPNVVGCSTP